MDIEERARRTPTRRVTAAAALVVALGVGGAQAAAAATGAQEAPRTPAAAQVEAEVPALGWEACEQAPGFECATAEVPTDYDRPEGASTTLAVTRLPATDPEQRIGSVFVNFGGPGGPGVANLHALGATMFAPEVRQRFDIVSFDPRAVGSSDPATCFRDAEAEAEFFAEVPGFPVTPREEARYLGTMAAFSTSCAVFSGERLRHSSSANVARDMDLLRQAVGDERLTYVGYSYGTILGANYGALFPDRVRAMVLDGTMDPVAWVGERDHRSIGTRSGQAEASTEAMGEFYRLCAEAGPDACALAALGDPEQVTEQVLADLREQPVDVPLPDGTTVEIGYDDTVAAMFQYLYTPLGWSELAGAIAELAVLNGPQGMQALSAPEVTSIGELLRRVGYAEDYASAGGALGAMCADAQHPLRPWEYPDHVDSVDAEAPHFGRFRAWVGIQCEFASFADRDAYQGPWEQTTDAPVLVIGTRYDPATPYSSTEPYAELWPDARMLTVEGYGHTTMPTPSACATGAIGTYLTTLEATDGTVCAQDVAPFTPVAAEQESAVVPGPVPVPAG